ncbi:MAG: aminotransferase class IV [Canibacter sp.]
MQRVIDSLLVRDHAAVALERHIERMTHAAAKLGYSAEEVTSKYLAVSKEVPDAGDWFPLIEATRDQFEVVMRPAPVLRLETQLRTTADRRRFPHAKGADANVTAADRQFAIDHGDDDAAYLVDGVLTECANGALLAWTGHGVTVSDSASVLQSTTLAEFLSHYAGPVTRGDIDPADELWYLNALHGLTPVTRLDGVQKHYDRERLALWRQRYESWRQPL